MNAPPICENCRRVVHKTRKVALMVDGDIEAVRELCSACKVHAADSFTQAAPLDRPAAGRTTVKHATDELAERLHYQRVLGAHDAWAFVERMAHEPHDLATPTMPSNLARELLAARADLIRSYENKVQDLARETSENGRLRHEIDLLTSALADFTGNA